MMQCKSNPNIYRVILYVLILLICIFATLDLSNAKITYKPITKPITNDIILHKDSIFNQLLEQDILFPELAIKSCLYETGYLTSNLATKHNNIFGITYNHNKYQTSYKICNGLKFGVYKSIKDCIRHYKIVQKYYAMQLDLKYSDNKQYTKTLMSIK
jgi:uncharacterized FlgJ-related protein